MLESHLLGPRHLRKTSDNYNLGIASDYSSAETQRDHSSDIQSIISHSTTGGILNQIMRLVVWLGSVNITDRTFRDTIFFWVTMFLVYGDPSTLLP